MGKDLKPSLDSGRWQHFGAMLFRVDIAVSASKIAGGKNVEKDVSGLLGERDCSFHKMRWIACERLFPEIHSAVFWPIYPVKLLRAFLAFMSSSLVNRKRAVTYSAKIR